MVDYAASLQAGWKESCIGGAVYAQGDRLGLVLAVFCLAPYLAPTTLLCWPTMRSESAAGWLVDHRVSAWEDAYA